MWFCRHCKEGGHAYEFAERQGSIPPEHISTTPKKKLEINWFEIEPTAIYDYTDADGKLLFQVLRKEYWNDGKREAKTFIQRRPDGNGGWIWSVPEEIRTLSAGD